MPKGRFIRRKAGKKKSGFLAPAVEDMLSKEKANVRARRVLDVQCSPLKFKPRAAKRFQEVFQL